MAIPDSFYAGTRAAESSGNPNAVNRITGAAGLYQFMPDTWAGVVRNHGQRYGIRPDGIMDPAQQELAIRAITENEYAPVLRRAGLPVTPENLYAVHLLGEPTFRNIAANPDLPAADALRNNRVSWGAIYGSNKGVFGDNPNISAAEALQRIAAYYTRKAGGSPVVPRKAPEAPQAPSPVASTPAPTAQVSWISRLISMVARIFRKSKNPK